MASLANSINHLKKKLMPILIKLFQNIKEEAVNLPNTFCEVNRTLLPRPGKSKTQKRKENTNISNEYRCKNPKVNII